MPEVPYAAGFKSQWNETSADDLPVEGRIPKWLTGTLIRNGPGAWDSEDDRQKIAHWFDGLAMLHRFGFDNGRVSFGNRFLRSESYEIFMNAKQRGEPRELGGFTRDPCRALFGKAMTVYEPMAGDNASVHVHPLDTQMLAMTETPMPVAFDVETLETLGFAGFDDDIEFNHGTAHPYLDPVTGEMVSYGLKFGRQSEYLFTELPRGSTSRSVVARIPTDRPAYLHSFGCTQTHIILAEWPIRTTAMTMLMAQNTGGGFMNAFAADKSLSTRFHLIDRLTGDVAAVCEAPPMFGFHHVNAFDDGDQIVCDIAVYDEVDVIGDLLMHRLRKGDGTLGTNGRLARFTLPLTGGEAKETELLAGTFELPRVRDELCGLKHQYAYGLSQPAGEAGSFLDRIVKHDADTGEAKLWHEPGCFPGEPVFVAEPGSDAIGEDDGVILSVVLDSAKQQSFVLVLDAVDLTEIGRAYAPQVVPFGFHGRFFEPA